MQITIHMFHLVNIKRYYYRTIVLGIDRNIILSITINTHTNLYTNLYADN